MCKNHGVTYVGQGQVEVREINYPKLALGDRKCEHGVILKVVSTNICGSDQHMVRGRTTASAGLILGHEITGEVIECGNDVEFIKKGDLVSVPFNIACGRCRNCKQGLTGICLNVNSERPGAAYGYVDMGGWLGGQSEYVMVPYADFNLLKFPNKDHAMEKIKDLTMLSDILPTGFHGAITAGVQAGSIVYIAGAEPVGLAAAASCHLLGAAVVIIGDLNQERLAHARTFGCETINLANGIPIEEQIAMIVGIPEVDCFIDCVGFEAVSHSGKSFEEKPAVVLNQAMAITRAGGQIGIPGLYVTEDPGAKASEAKQGSLKIRFGLGWAKSHSFHTGQCPVMKYHRQLMNAILYDRIDIAKAVNVEVISLKDAPKGYAEFDKGVAKKFVIDPHGLIA
ncbi:formaldehyde dehydrogenase, glutathione-independent [Tenacibaculum sp. nBUS_03]|uniref:formaldehyde dehydrogenase, glutathione-independent n=1 Tax=Tenacibaculum sp. nBUS_03 TaxID=3395320 RepID=UPI003EBA5C32